MSEIPEAEIMKAKAWYEQDLRPRMKTGEGKSIPELLAEYGRHIAAEKDAEIERLRGGLSNLVEAVDDLIAESEGVYGLRLDGTPSLWEELIEVGWLRALEEARAALDGEKADG